jgi:[pyruvate, water dikinase]-phosphate phosphotransferase / [pyruvate, water dikinase] kinase
MLTQRTVFFISDGTGITAETFGKSLLTQFEQIEFEYITIPYVNKIEKIPQVLQQIKAAYNKNGQRPILFVTLLNTEISTLLKTSEGLVIDFFQTFLTTLENEFGYRSSHTIGKFHSAKNYSSYMLRINAINYALLGDDGSNTKEYKDADIILVGVSRSGKTPTSLYLALQFGIFAANYPITEEDLKLKNLPAVLHNYRDRLFGLFLDPMRLCQIRQERYPNSNYASYEQCQLEIEQVKVLFQKEGIPFLDATVRSIEELAADILTLKNLKRRI